MYVVFALVSLFALLFAFVGVTELAVAATSKRLGLEQFRLFSVNPPRRSPRALWISAAAVLAPLIPIWMLGLVEFGLHGKDTSTHFVDVPEGPARQAGLRDGDRVVAVARNSTPDFSAIVAELQVSTGPAELVVERDGRRLEFVVPRDANGRIGVRGRHGAVPLPAAELASEALLQPFRILGTMLASSNDKVELMGPVGIVRQTRAEPTAGVFSALRLLALLGSVLWPAFALAAVIDSVTLPLFRRFSPDVLLARSDSELESFRIARLQELCVWLLVVFLGTGLLAALLEAVSSSAPLLNLVAFALGPTLVLCAWALARALYGTARATLVLFAAPLPCVNLVFLLGLVVAARRALAARGLQAGFLGTRQS